MNASVKSLFVSAVICLVFCSLILLVVFMILTNQDPKDVINDISNSGKLILYKYGMVEKLSSNEITRLYQETCTRKCHGKDVIEKTPRTASEWDSVVNRMKVPDRAGISDRHAETITRYLQSHFLSNVPTVLPEKTMKFVKRYLWRSDFGESDLFLDIIYIPREHLNLLRYLGVRDTPQNQQAAYFVVYLNTHQGSLPPWDLAKMVTLHDSNDHSQNAISWVVLYKDGQRHHNQGVLTFPNIDTRNVTDLDINIRLPGLGTRTFQWSLPIPPLTERDPVEH